MTNPTNTPLWRVMHDAFLGVDLRDGGHKGIAAELRAISTRLLERGRHINVDADSFAWVIRYLSKEADRAERGVE